MTGIVFATYGAPLVATLKLTGDQQPCCQSATPVIGIVVGSGGDGNEGVVAVTGASNSVLAVADAATKAPPQQRGGGGNYSNHVSVTQSLLQARM